MPIHRCCVEGCKSRKPQVKLFNLPTNDALREIWMQYLIPRSPALQNTKQTKELLIQRKVCILHFEDKYLIGNNRKRLSCPTLFSEEEILSRKPTSPIEFSFEKVHLDDHSYAFQSENAPGPSIQHQLHQNENNQVIVSGRVLNVLFDPPHLMKGIRNNFLTKDMLFCGKVAKWQDIIDAYKTDCEVGEIRMVRKLTDEHVIPAKIKKMKVKNATQALSEQTASLLSFCSKFSVHDTGKPVSQTMKNTSDAVLFFDKLFDSVNGSRRGAAPGKMRGPVKEVNGRSQHVTFWEEAIKILDDIYYLDNSTSQSVSGLVKKRVPSLKNWIITLKSFIAIWRQLKQKGIKFFYTRNLNQDPLENFFGRVRAFNYRNNNPTPYHFACTVKSLLINNIMGPHSPGSNCEDDVGEIVLRSGLLAHIGEHDYAGSMSDAAPAQAPGGVAQPQCSSFTSARREKINVQASAFTAGFVTRRLIQSIPCKDCKKSMLTNEIGDIHDWISQRERRLLKGRNLKYPNEAFICLFRKLVKFINKYLDSRAHKGDVMTNIRTEFLIYYDVDWLGCSQHRSEVLNRFMTLVCRVQIHNWCNSINKILRGMFSEKLTANISKMQSLALKKYKSSRARK